MTSMRPPIAAPVRIAPLDPTSAMVDTGAGKSEYFARLPGASLAVDGGTTA
jgi:hypothetical protein